jgi:hypothetical protein
MKKTKKALPTFRPRNGHVSAMLKLNGGPHDKPYRTVRRQEKASLRSDMRVNRASEGYQHETTLRSDFLPAAFNFHDFYNLSLIEQHA